MPNLIYPDDGLVTQLTEILTPGVVFMLHNAPAEPTLGVTLAALTPYEVVVSGYSRTNVPFSAWTLGVSAHQGYGLAAPLSWTNGSGSPVTVAGYAVLDSTQTHVLASYYFPSPVTWNAGTPLQVVPTWALQSQYST